MDRTTTFQPCMNKIANVGNTVILTLATFPLLISAWLPLCESRDHQGLTDIMFSSTFAEDRSGWK